MILVRQNGYLPMMQPAVAIGVDGGMIVLKDPVVMPGDDGAVQTNIVPPDVCYEFDPDFMQRVNGLVSTAMDALTAVEKLINIQGEHIRMEDFGDEAETVFH